MDLDATADRPSWVFVAREGTTCLARHWSPSFFFAPPTSKPLIPAPCQSRPRSDTLALFQPNTEQKWSAPQRNRTDQHQHRERRARRRTAYERSTSHGRPAMMVPPSFIRPCSQSLGCAFSSLARGWRALPEAEVVVGSTFHRTSVELYQRHADRGDGSGRCVTCGQPSDGDRSTSHAAAGWTGLRSLATEPTTNPFTSLDRHARRQRLLGRRPRPPR